MYVAHDIHHDVNSCFLFSRATLLLLMLTCVCVFVLFFFFKELPARGTVALLSAHLELTERLQRRLVEFMVLVASRHVTNTDLAPLIRLVHAKKRRI